MGYSRTKFTRAPPRPRHHHQDQDHQENPLTKAIMLYKALTATLLLSSACAMKRRSLAGNTLEKMFSFTGRASRHVKWLGERRRFGLFNERVTTVSDLRNKGYRGWQVLCSRFRPSRGDNLWFQVEPARSVRAYFTKHWTGPKKKGEQIVDRLQGSQVWTTYHPKFQNADEFEKIISAWYIDDKSIKLACDIRKRYQKWCGNHWDF